MSTYPTMPTRVRRDSTLYRVLSALSRAHEPLTVPEMCAAMDVPDSEQETVLKAVRRGVADNLLVTAGRRDGTGGLLYERIPVTGRARVAASTARPGLPKQRKRIGTAIDLDGVPAVYSETETDTYGQACYDAGHAAGLAAGMRAGRIAEIESPSPGTQAQRDQHAADRRRLHGQ